MPRFLARLIAPVWRALPDRVNWWLLGFLHPRYMVTVTGVLFDDAGHVLLVRHRWWDGQAWGFPSGYLRRSESPEVALAREVREETSLTTHDLQIIRATIGRSPWVEIMFAGAVTGDLHLDEGEILAAHFVAVDDLAADLPEAYREAIALGHEMIGSVPKKE